MTEPPSIIPFWGSSMATAMKSTIQSTSSNPGGGSTDRALGAAASLGLCLAILRVVGFSYNASKHLDVGESKEKPSPNKSSSRTLSHFLLNFVRNFLKKMLLDDDGDAFDDNFDDNVDPNRSSSITHAGSCHCGCIGFEVMAPRRLQARDGVGKIQYRHTKVKTSSFQVLKGQQYMKTYYVMSDNSYDRGAHAFCQQCGVHILYAPWKNSPHLFINVNCLGQGVRKVKSGDGIDSILDAVPVDMDNQSTVSEVSGDSRWNLFLHHQNSSASTVGMNDDVSISDYSYTRKPHQNSISHSLTAQTELSSSASLMTRIESDDSTVRSYKSARTTGSISLQPLQVPIAYQHVSPAEQNVSPAMRDQMKKYMSRHLNGEKKSGGEEAKTIQTMKKQTIHSVSRAPVGEHNKYI